MNFKDILIRASKTFLQTFISYLTIDGVFGISDKAGLKRFALTTGLSALAAAVSAVWNLILEIASEKAGEAIDKIDGEEEEEIIVVEETEEHITTATKSDETICLEPMAPIGDTVSMGYVEVIDEAEVEEVEGVG